VDTATSLAVSRPFMAQFLEVLQVFVSKLETHLASSSKQQKCSLPAYCGSSEFRAAFVPVGQIEVVGHRAAGPQ